MMIDYWFHDFNLKFFKLLFLVFLLPFSPSLFGQFESTELESELFERIKQERYSINEIACQNTNFQNITELLSRWNKSGVALDTIEASLIATFRYHKLSQLTNDSIVSRMLDKPRISKITNYFMIEDLEVMDENPFFISLLSDNLTTLKFNKLIEITDYEYHCLDTVANVSYKKENNRILKYLVHWDILDRDNILYVPSKYKIGMTGYLIKEIYPNLQLYIWKDDQAQFATKRIFEEFDSLKLQSNSQY